ncbi:hypothetical protein [Nesterenkonia muleiensis]|uniref:hypothetical protein n=1 Tax=Nesterenkonia muleiensis TaxID=2282648 RepID=UPI000E7575BD|nr:hypothetical protein [Nesterenkonia muleiensis]
MMFICWVWFQGFALLALGLWMEDRAEGWYHAAMAAGLATVVIGVPMGLLGMLLWWPRFLLPGWIRERLAAGDPVRTAVPIPQVRDQMRRRANRRAIERITFPEGETRLPITFPVGMARWLVSTLMMAVGSVLLWGVLFGIPPHWFAEDTSPMLQVIRTLSIVGAPLSVFLVFHYGRGVLFPQHLKLTESGLSTRGWSISWDELEGTHVKGDESSHKGQLFLHVVPEALEREGSGARWFSGRPVGTGGMKPAGNVIGIQPGTKDAPARMEKIIQEHATRADAPPKGHSRP